MFSKTMFAKDRAKELYSKYHTPLLKYRDGLNIEEVNKMQVCAKECALVAVEIAVTDLAFVIPKEAFEFWEQVKLEIESM
jgi:hypothetical protein